MDTDFSPRECLDEEIVNMQLASIEFVDSKACGDYLGMDFSNEDC